MGIYYGTSVYYGRLLSQDAYDRIKPYIESSWITDLKDERGRYILAPPDCIVNLGSIDPMIEDSEVYQGFVHWKDVSNLCSTSPIKNDKIFKMIDIMSDSSIVEKLKKYVKDASANNTDDTVGIYIIEVCWGTIGDSCRVTKNLPCK